ncbi:hypothetical protein HBI88_093020 [Parastagonospora nodorum]|nr:hypothetical protein HBH77_069060 [Parastagonospora nodorum]KAH5358352.1 hypothetical protein HBI48_116580 [Parastagonospora nodorum]KAH5512632.1 hypothetical protein HBI52_121730 [Parastagonospora nodorum]KAH5760531.1 hypothetical protein HBI16_189080 [Parastagonospora nodorum]KAH5778765.1 hypothetical protein HBI97_119720 [Parastagonospora nodorum]
MLRRLDACATLMLMNTASTAIRVLLNAEYKARTHRSQAGSLGGVIRPLKSDNSPAATETRIALRPHV